MEEPTPDGNDLKQWTAIQNKYGVEGALTILLGWRNFRFGRVRGLSLWNVLPPNPTDGFPYGQVKNGSTSPLKQAIFTPNRFAFSP